MTPRTDIKYIHIDGSIDDLLQLISATGYSRIPITGDSLDDIRGIIHVRDLVNLIYRKEDVKLEGLLHDIFYTYESKKALELLEELQIKGVHMTIVLDEYGGTAGIITMEDLLEEIVGDIHDRHNPDEKRIRKTSDNSYLIKGYTEIREVNERLQLHIPYSKDYDTIAGFVLDQLRYMPKAGESFLYKDWMISIENVKRNRITQIKINNEEN